MPLTRPTLLNVTAFDATQQQTFIFVVTGSSAQITANRLTIRNQETNAIVYNEKQETFRYEHIVNANELTNNTYYNAVITVFDADDNESPASIPIQFWCYSEPTVEFTNIPTSGIIANASFTFEFTYNQSEGERINSYILNLYNASQEQISTSGLQYVQEGIPPYSNSYTFTGFENNGVYYVELSIATLEGTVVSTGLEQFTVQYEHPDIFTLIELQNNCADGYIVVRSNFVLIEGESNPDPPTYIDNKEVDLTGDGSWVKWDEGFSISGDMLARMWFRKPNPYTQIASFSNTSGQQIIVNYMLGYENVEAADMEAYVEIYVTSYEGTQYYIFSNYIPPLADTEYYTVYLTRVDDIYQLQLLPTN